MSQQPAHAAHVLVVEDDPSLSQIVCAFLELNGYACTPAFSGTEARLLLQDPAASYDLVVCDLMLPGMPGEELIAQLRANPGTVRLPVVVVSAKGQVSDRVDVLRMGADDYLVKPFPLEELLARIEVQLRRAGLSAAVEPPAPSTERRFGQWRADASTRQFYVNGTPIRLTRTEFDLAWLLMGSPNRVFTRQELLEAVHGTGDLGEEKTASTHVGNIRAKLKGTGTETYIQTVWGIGFKLAL